MKSKLLILLLLLATVVSNSKSQTRTEKTRTATIKPLPSPIRLATSEDVDFFGTYFNDHFSHDDAQLKFFRAGNIRIIVGEGGILVKPLRRSLKQEQITASANRHFDNELYQKSEIKTVNGKEYLIIWYNVKGHRKIRFRSDYNESFQFVQGTIDFKDEDAESAFNLMDLFLKNIDLP